MKQTFFLLTFLLFALLQNAFSQNLTFPVNVLEGLQNGQISITHSPIQPGEGVIENAFSGGALNNYARSVENPMLVTLSFSYPFQITETSIYSHNVETGVWTVEAANSLADLNAKTGSYKMLVNQAPYTSYIIHTAPLTPFTGRVLRLTMLKQTGATMPTLGEWGIVATANISVTSLCMQPNQVRLIPNSNYQPSLVGTDTDGNEWPIPSTINWQSSNSSVVAVNSAGVFSSTSNLGEANITASWQGLNFQTKVKVVQDFVSTNADKRVIKVALVIIDPQIPAAGGQRFSERFWAFNGGPMAMTQQVRDSIFSVSGGTVEIQIAETHHETDLSLNRFGGNILSVDSMYRLFLEPGWTTLHTVAEQTPGGSIFQYNDLLNKYNLCSKSNAKQIDEVWVWAMPFIGMWESNMTGTGAFWINGPVIENNSCTDLISIMGFNYERYAGCALHNYTHRIELTMAKVYNTFYNYSPSNPPYPPGMVKTPYQLFQNYDALQGESGQAHVGNGHFPPNGVQDYDYANLNFVPSREVNWKRYPLLFDQTTQVNCSAWGCEGDCGINYCSWWLRHLPHFKCKDKYGRLNNWWTYIFDYNEGKAMEAQIDDCNCQMFADDPTPNCASKGEFPWHEWISRVKIGNLDNPSGKTQYSDFTAKTLTLNPGSSYVFSVSTGFSYFTYDEYFRVWVDFNKNGVFEDNEKLAEGILPRPADGTPEASSALLPNPINVPFGIPTVAGLKMRVSMKRGGYPTPCETIPFGEVEDYTVNIGGPPPTMQNLSVFNWSAPASGTPGQNQNGTFDLSNSGIPPVLTAFSVGVFLSTDNLFGPNDQLVGNKNYPPNSTGGLLGQTINYTIPANATPGAYFLILKVDYTDAITELSETDNTLVLPYTVSGGTQPDLASVGWEIIPANQNCYTNPGQAMTFFGGLVINFGPGSAGPFTAKAYLSSDNQLSVNDILWQTLNYTGLGPNGGSNYTAGLTITAPIPASTPPGQYFVIVKVDADDQIGESNEGNNLFVNPLQIGPGGNCGGQYCASKGSFPWEDWISGVSVGGNTKTSGKSQYSDFTSTSFSVANGTPVTLTTAYSYFTFDEYWRIWIDLNKDGDFSDAGEKVFEQILTRPADGTTSKSINGALTLPAGSYSGTTRMRVSMKRGAYPDPCETFGFGEVEDYTVQFGGTVNLPDLQLANLNPGSTSVQQGAVLNFNFDLKNTGTAAASGNFNVKSWLSTDNVLDAGDYQDGVVPTGNIAAGTTVPQVLGAMTVAQNVAPGQYFLILKVDADGQIPESDENNNVLVSTGKITVTPGGPGGGADLEVTLTADKTTAPIYSNVTFTVTAKNNGSQMITNAVVAVSPCPLVGGVPLSFSQASQLVYAGVPGQPTLGSFNFVEQRWTLTNLAPGQSGVLKFTLFTLGSAERKVAAFGYAQSPNDPDSQPAGSPPANCQPTQDDEAVWTINAGQSVLQPGDRKDEIGNFEIGNFRIYPNPAGDQVFIVLKNWEGKPARLTLFNQLGVNVLEKNFEKISDAPEVLDLSGVPGGQYFLKMETAGERAVFGKLVVARMY